MPRLSDLLKNNCPLSVPYRGAVISITYKPESVTSEQQAKLQERVDKGEIKRGDLDAAMICDVVTTWDLTDDDDQPLPLTFEVVSARSNSMLMAIVRAIYDDQQNPQQGH